MWCCLLLFMRHKEQQKSANAIETADNNSSKCKATYICRQLCCCCSWFRIFHWNIILLTLYVPKCVCAIVTSNICMGQCVRMIVYLCFKVRINVLKVKYLILWKNYQNLFTYMYIDLLAKELYTLIDYYKVKVYNISCLFSFIGFFIYTLRIRHSVQCMYQFIVIVCCM